MFIELNIGSVEKYISIFQWLRFFRQMFQQYERILERISWVHQQIFINVKISHLDINVFYIIFLIIFILVLFKILEKYPCKIASRFAIDSLPDKDCYPT